MAKALNEYIVDLEGKRYKITSDRDLSADQQRAMALRGIGKMEARPPQLQQGPSLTEGPYPGGGSEPPPELPEMSFLARAPAEVGLPAVAGTLAGALSGPAAPAMVPLVSGGAQLLGSELNKKVIAPALGYAPPQPSFSNDPGREAALQFGTGLAAEAIPGAAIAGAKRLMTGPTPPAASRTLEAFAETGVQPKMTDISTSRFPAAMESFTRQTLTGAPIIDKTIKTQATDLTSAAAEFTRDLGPLLAQSEQATGQSVKQAITSGLERGKSIEDSMWNELKSLGHGVQITPMNAVQWADDVLARGRKGLESAQDSGSKALAREILEKSTTGKGPNRELRAVPFDQADLWRKDIGQTLTKPEMISGVDQGRLRHLYGGVLDDIQTGIQYTGDQALMDAHAGVRAFSQRLRALYRDSSVADVIDLAPEQVMGKLNGTRGVTDLRQWKAGILGDDPRMGPPTPEAQAAWNMTRRHIFESMLGETTHGPGKAVDMAPRGSSATSMISGKRLGAIVDRMGEDVMNELLDPTERRALSNIRIVANALGKGGRVGAVPYTSITAQNAGIQTLISSMGALGGMAAGQPAAVATGLAASLMVPPAIAKLLTSPRAIETLASPEFGRLAMEFGQRKLSREGAATLIRLVPLASEAEQE